MKKIGIFGGTFDPIHIGHLIIAQSVKDFLNLDKVIFVPNGNPPHKNTTKANQFDRLEMIKIAIEENKNFEVFDIEINATETYTINTIQKLKKIYTEDELFFIMGTDSIINFKSWYQYEKLLKLCNFAIIPRVISKNNLEKIVYKESELKLWILDSLNISIEHFFFIDSPLVEISSTKIRENLAKNLSIRYLVPNKVLEYIYQKKIY